MDSPKHFPKSADDSQFHMIDVGGKTPTQRRAVAQGRLYAARETIERIRAGTLPKGNVLGMAEVAGIMAAKRTSDILPLCHPLPLDAVRVWSEVNTTDGYVEVFCEAKTHGKTGVEMEALTGASAALLSIYDLTKGVDPALTISQIYLAVKEGGKSGVWTHPTHAKTGPKVTEQKPCYENLKCAVVTISDRASKGEYEDLSGAVIREHLLKNGANILDTKIVPDEVKQIQSAVLHAAKELRADLIITTGGTGLGPRDVTPEALNSLWTKEIDGIGELLRKHGSQYTQNAWLSRSTAGVIENSLVVLLPGSKNAVKEGLEVLDSLAIHSVRMILGEGHK